MLRRPPRSKRPDIRVLYATLFRATALPQPQDSADAVGRALEKQAGSGTSKPALAVWMGGDAQANSTLNAAGVPTYASEAEAVRGFMSLVRHREAQQALM